MAKATEFTAEQARAWVARKYGDGLFGEAAGIALTTIDRWLARGDGAAFFENADLGSAEVGLGKAVSFGSERAQLEPFCGTCRGKLAVAQGFRHAAGMPADGHAVQYPPQRLPDIGGQINWRFQLAGWYRGAPLGGAS